MTKNGEHRGILPRLLDWLEEVNGPYPKPSRRDPFGVRGIVPGSPNSVRTDGPGVREITSNTPNSIRTGGPSIRN